MTKYLEVKIWSYFNFGNETKANKILRKKRRNCFSSFPQYFQYISDFRSQIVYSFVKCGCWSYFFSLNSANLICRGTDNSNCFRESSGLRENENRLYLFYSYFFIYTIHVYFVRVTLLAKKNHSTKRPFINP